MTDDQANQDNGLPAPAWTCRSTLTRQVKAAQHRRGLKRWLRARGIAYSEWHTYNETALRKLVRAAVAQEADSDRDSSSKAGATHRGTCAFSTPEKCPHYRSQ